MILTEVTGEDRYPRLVMDRFVRPQRRVLLEFLTRDYEELPGSEGTFVNPGHAIESMWFVMHWAQHRGDTETIARASEVLRWHLEAGWDREYGGIFLGIDAAGGIPFLPHSDKKMWWPHTEALYALLLAHRLTGESWCVEWYFYSGREFCNPAHSNPTHSSPGHSSRITATARFRRIAINRTTPPIHITEVDGSGVLSTFQLPWGFPALPLTYPL